MPKSLHTIASACVSTATCTTSCQAKRGRLPVKISGTTIGHPTTGPVTTDDCIDAISLLVTQLSVENPSVHQQLSDLRPYASPFPRNPAAHLFEEFSRTGPKRRLMQQLSYDRHMNPRR